MGRRTNLENLFYDTVKKAYKDGGSLNENVTLLNVKDIISMRTNKRISEKYIDALADNIEENGIIYPIVVYKKDNQYILIEGEKRLRAVKKLKIDQIEGIVKDLNEKQAGAQSIIENLKNYEKDPVNEARAYRYLINNFGFTQKLLSDQIEKSRPYIANAIRLLNLHPQILEWLDEEKITVGHAKCLSALKNQAAQMNFAKAVVDYSLSVRLLEGMVKRYNNPKKKEDLKYVLPKDLAQLVKKCEKVFDMKTSLKGTVKKGEITLTYFDRETLDRLDKVLDIIKKTNKSLIEDN